MTTWEKQRRCEHTKVHVDEYLNKPAVLRLFMWESSLIDEKRNGLNRFYIETNPKKTQRGGKGPNHQTNVESSPLTFEKVVCRHTPSNRK